MGTTPGRIVTNAAGASSVSPVFDMVALGADPTGTADAHTIFNSALSSAANGGEIDFPCGTYKMTADVAQSLAAGKHLKLKGAGTDCTTLTFPSGNGLTITEGSQFSSIDVEDITFTTGSDPSTEAAV